MQLSQLAVLHHHLNERSSQVLAPARSDPSSFISDGRLGDNPPSIDYYAPRGLIFPRATPGLPAAMSARAEAPRTDPTGDKPHAAC